MRKLLMGLLVFILLIGTSLIMVNGLQLIKTEGFLGLDEKNAQLDQEIEKLSKLVNTSYPNSTQNLKKAQTSYAQSKTQYENKAIALNSVNSSYALQLEIYDIDYLWTKLGNYAKEENVEIKIDIKTSGLSSNLFDLNFTVTGDYSNITDFIYDIENDSKLGFKIDDFKMFGGTDSLNATFVCADIPIDLKELSTSSSKEQTEEENTDTEEDSDETTKEDEKGENNKETDTTNTEKNTSTSNTSNTSKTTNSSDTSNITKSNDTEKSSSKNN